jgi:hypothetical protein
MHFTRNLLVVLILKMVSAQNETSLLSQINETFLITSKLRFE